MDYSGWSEAIIERFPGHKSTEAEAAWVDLKRRFSPGDKVSGTVVSRAHFGAWIDLGVGFPALLEIVHIEGLTPERYQRGDWCPVGSQVEAFVGAFADRDRQIRLLQVPTIKNQIGPSPSTETT